MVEKTIIENHQKMVEFFSDQGDLSERYYNLLNKKSAEENYADIVNQRKTVYNHELVDAVAERIAYEIVNELNIK